MAVKKATTTDDLTAEAKDLSADQPERAKQMLALWERWNAQMVPPRWTDRRWDGAEARAARKGKEQDP